MKIARYLSQGQERLGCFDGHRLHDLQHAFPQITDMAQAMSPAGQVALRGFQPTDMGVDPSTVQWLPPLAASSRIFCIGINYRDHAAETGRAMPPFPSVFIRTHESVVGHGDDMVRPVASSHYDFEGELVVVIGEGGRNLTQDQAMSRVAGYTCFNDGSLRDFQKHALTCGKNFDQSGACGPWIVTADEIPDPTQLQLRTRLNGVEVQHASTDMLIYSLPFLVSHLSQVTQLRPGDLISTGTPAGVGMGRQPPLWMKPGDRIEVEISGIGCLSNPVVGA
jgi:2-keto-4-pentenoate hydratase/2-oxohepta-3-ene-1,7-dioic acid hydratase in catechol pathway